MAKPFEVTDSTFQDQVLNSPTPVLVDFWAEWCGPCRMVAPVLEQIATEHDGELKIAKMDVDHNNQTPIQYGIRGIPTMILFKGGNPVERIVGFQPKAQLLQRLQPHFD